MTASVAFINESRPLGVCRAKCSPHLQAHVTAKAELDGMPATRQLAYSEDRMPAGAIAKDRYFLIDQGLCTRPQRNFQTDNPEMWLDRCFLLRLF